MGTYSKKNKIWKNIFMITTVIFLVISLILGAVVFFNWDYISFKALMTQRYLHTEIMDELINENVGVESNGDFFKYFDNLSITAVTDLISATGKDNHTFQYNPSQYESYSTWRTEKAAESHIKELTPDTVYMLLTNFTDDTLEFFTNSVDVIKSYENLVLDLRGNGGGDIDVILEIADYFVDDGTVMLREFRRNKTTDIKAKTTKTLDFDNIVILQDGRTASASEQLITILTYTVDSTTTVGTPTYGKYVGQTSIALLRGFYVRATTLEWTAPDGTALAEGGISPDYTYTDDPDIIEFVLDTIL